MRNPVGVTSTWFIAKSLGCKFVSWMKFVCVLQLNNRLFEELAMDVYDEVDRRENDAGGPHSASLPSYLVPYQMTKKRFHLL